MHLAAYDYIAAQVATLGLFRSVIEVGSADMNGSVRPLFGDARYTGVDIQAGPGVDVVDDGTWTPPAPVDCVVIAEVFEHTPDWPAILRRARGWLRPGGTLIVTCAGPGRRPHSGIDGKRRLHPGEHYRNVPADDLACELDLAGYDTVKVDTVGADVRAVACRPGAVTVVGVPFVDELARTRRITHQLLRDPMVDRVVLADNGSTDPDTLAWLERIIDPRIVVEHRPPLGPGRSIYTIWNEHTAAALAAHPGPVTMVLLNNDIGLPERAVGQLARALRTAPADVAAVYPDWSRPLSAGTRLTGGLTRTRGAWRSGGMSGFAFAFKAELIRDRILPLFDERYEWIFGDSDWVEAIQDRGFCAARVDGLPLEHDKSTTAGRMTWVSEAKHRDVKRRKEKVAGRAVAS